MFHLPLLQLQTSLIVLRCVSEVGGCMECDLNPHSFGGIAQIWFIWWGMCLKCKPHAGLDSLRHFWEAFLEWSFDGSASKASGKLYRQLGLLPTLIGFHMTALMLCANLWFYLACFRNEKGAYYALDLGGTNFRVLRVQLRGERSTIIEPHVEQQPIPEHLMTSTSEVPKILLISMLILSCWLCPQVIVHFYDVNKDPCQY